MLKNPEDFIREFPTVWKTDRDAEVPILIEYLQKLAPIKSLLDVGASSSSREDKYGQQIRPMVEKYDGVDIVDDPEARQLLDNYFVGNVNQMNLPKYDVVICVSVLEHAGISTYKKEDFKKERFDLFCKCLELTKKHLWISFDCGQEYTYPNELSLITEDELKRFEKIASNFKVKKRFFHNSGGPQSGTPWREHANQKAAYLQPYFDYVGNQSITILEIEKGGDVK